MIDIFKKEIGIISENQYNMLKNAYIILIGLGGVGGYTLEGIVRSGIENLAIIDKDVFEDSNINRQLCALNDTLNNKKTDVYKIRCKKINPNVKIYDYNTKIYDNNCAFIFNKIISENFNIDINDKNSTNNLYIVDCIDDINAKYGIINYALNHDIKIISCMGTANHLSTDKLKIDLLIKTKYCPVAKKLRSLLKNINYDKVYALYIEEEPYINDKLSTMSYVPAIAGLKISEHVIKQIISSKNN